ncbi:MAG: hypothetical protein JWP89_6455 [Schlesneria sp.]|nr:hypothetical protein [Schlesneria sp.]
MKHRLLTAAISAVLLFFFAVPLGFMLYGAGSAISGLLLLGGLIALQAPAFFLCQRCGWIPTVERETGSASPRRPHSSNEA